MNKRDLDRHITRSDEALENPKESTLAAAAAALDDAGLGNDVVALTVPDYLTLVRQSEKSRARSKALRTLNKAYVLQAGRQMFLVERLAELEQYILALKAEHAELQYRMESLEK